MLLLLMVLSYYQIQDRAKNLLKASTRIRVLGPSPSVLSKKKIQSTETYADTMLRSGDFFRKRAR